MADERGVQLSITAIHEPIWILEWCSRAGCKPGEAAFPAPGSLASHGKRSHSLVIYTVLGCWGTIQCVRIGGEKEM